LLVVTQLTNGNLSIKSDYYYKDRIKRIPSAQFDPERKEWVILKEYLANLEQEFAGELVYKTPRWIIRGDPMPDYSDMYKITNNNITLPNLKIEPYDYQKYGIKFMIDKIQKHNFVLNADDVGLGKTFQAIAVIKWFMENYLFRKILIVCKKSIKKQWMDEFSKFTDIHDNIPIVYTKTTPKKRAAAYAVIDNSPQGILITNYHTFLNDTDKIKSLGFDMCVIDEVHSVKARNGKLNNNISQVVRGKPTIFLTGTPIMSRPEDIFGIVQMVNRNYFGSYFDFSRRFLTTDLYSKFGPKIVGAKNLDELRNKVQDIVIRRTEYEVAVQLPEVILQQKDCEMDPTQVKIAKAIHAKSEFIMDGMESLMTEAAKPNVDKDVIANKLKVLDAQSKALIAARQAVANDPRLFLSSNSIAMRKDYGILIPKSYTMSPKTESILETVEDIVSNGDKVILFTKFRTCARMVKQDIEQNLKTNALLYTGGENDDQRNDALDLFRNTSTYNILIGTEALAEGVNLQVAKYVINIDQPDTFAIKTQRIGRARRVGSQFDNVIVYDMITKSEGGVISKDEERLRNITNNEDLTDALVTLNEAQQKAIIEAMKEEQ